MIGLGIGPSAVAWCTDLIYKDPMQVGMSLLWVSTLFGVFASLLLYLGMRHFRTSMKNLDDWQNGKEVEQYTEGQMYTTLTIIIFFVVFSVVALIVGLPWWLNTVFYSACVLGALYAYLTRSAGKTA